MKITMYYVSGSPDNSCIVKVWTEDEPLWPWLTFTFSKKDACDFMQFWGRLEQEKQSLQQRIRELEEELRAPRNSGDG
jgi:hypothetical protein